MTARDVVFVEGLVLYGHHGVHPEEQALGQRFVIDLAVETDLRAAGERDDLALGISYSELVRLAREVVEGPPRKLLEALAEELAARVLAALPATAVTVTVRKPGAPVHGLTSGTPGVRIRRERSRP